MPKVSIILPLYDSSPLLRKFTLNALRCIREHTPEDLYELIIVDNKVRGMKDADDRLQKIKSTVRNLDYSGSEALDINDEHCTIIDNDPDIGYYASMNQAAKVAKGQYLLFTQNDIMVLPNWLEDLCYYLDHNLTDAIFPDMMAHGRKFRLEHDKMSHEENLVPGCIESGMVLVKREAFDAIGGWYDELWQEIGWKVFIYSLSEKGYRYHSTHKVPIIHINQASRDGLEFEDIDKYLEIMHNDHEKANEWEHYYRERHGLEHPPFDKIAFPPND